MIFLLAAYPGRTQAHQVAYLYCAMISDWTSLYLIVTANV